MFHGSNHDIQDQLEPHISFDSQPYVYGTHDFAYALIRAGKFDPERPLIKEDYDGTFQLITLVELQPNAFRETFDTVGYIYLVSNEYFTPLGNDYVSSSPVPIVNQTLIPNVWDFILRSPHINLIYYNGSDSYWQQLEGGKEAYMKRRYSRIEKLKGDISHEHR